MKISLEAEKWISFIWSPIQVSTLIAAIVVIDFAKLFKSYFNNYSQLAKYFLISWIVFMTETCAEGELYPYYRQYYIQFVQCSPNVESGESVFVPMCIVCFHWINKVFLPWILEFLWILIHAIVLNISLISLQRVDSRYYDDQGNEKKNRRKIKLGCANLSEYNEVSL